MASFTEIKIAWDFDRPIDSFVAFNTFNNRPLQVLWRPFWNVTRPLHESEIICDFFADCCR
jgi:hypothetical protein